MSFAPLPDGEHLYYEVHGDGPPLLIITGLGGLAAFWHPHLDALAASFRIILYDHRGCGQSSLKPIAFSVEQMAADALALMHHLDLERVSIAGHSTGGAIGQVLAIEHSARLERLMLCASWPGSDPYFDLLFHVRSNVLKSQGPAEYIRQTVLFGRPPEWLRDHPEDSALPDDETVCALMQSVECTLGRIAAIRAFDRRADLNLITTPVFVTCANDDMVTPVHLSRELIAAIPGATADFLDWGGHFYPVIRPEEFRRQIFAFMGS
jgi:aminoacrylate hydrolase